jgi:uncharacterized protein (DUF849 family)
VSRPDARILVLSAGATDAHVHVVDPARRPHAPDAAYRPLPMRRRILVDTPAKLFGFG